MARVLITGSSGFTGKYLTLKLKTQGFEVFGLTTNGSVLGSSIDLRQYSQVYSFIKKLRPEFVVHLAAISYVAHGDSNEIFEVNVQGTENLLKALSQHRESLQKIIIASSANVYGNVDIDGVGISELVPPCPVNDYARSKLLMEHLVQENFSDIPFLITRPFNYTGVGQSGRFLVPKIVEAFKYRKERLVLGNLDVYRDFSDVRDVTDSYVNLLLSPCCHSIVNICSGRLYSIKDIIQLCTDLSGHCPEVLSDDSIKRKNELKILLGDNTKLKQILGRSFSIKLDQTLQWMLRG